MKRIEDIIPQEEIEILLERAKEASLKEAEAIVRKAESLSGLTPEETAILLQCKDGWIRELLYKTAEKVKESIYGKRLVLFAPLYLSNRCVNQCLYCGFRKGNQSLSRKTLTGEEIRSETEALIRDGHKRVLVVTGEDPKECGIDYIERAIDIIYSTRIGNGEIRRININVAPLTVEEFRRLKSAGIGTYQLFQETYHIPTYKKVHPKGPKSNYHYRLTAMDRAMEAGIDDVGIGALFGLYDYKFEVLALLHHAQHLENRFGVGPHTISVPRIEPAVNAPYSINPPHAVPDEDFMKLVAILRLAIPYTGIILSTRERAELRDRLFHIGVSQISASSRPYPGGYSERDSENQRDRAALALSPSDALRVNSAKNVPPIDERRGFPTPSPLPLTGGVKGEGGIGSPDNKGQFSIGDFRTTEEVIRAIAQDGFSPSFCTACYRVGRTGKEFMDHAKPGEIKRFCLPNSILSFKEYLLDYGGEELRKIGETLIEEETASIEDPKLRKATLRKLEEIEEGKRDLYF